MRKWIDVKDKLPEDNRCCELKCEKGLTWGYYDKEFDGWLIDVTKQFVESKDMDMGRVLKWRYMEEQNEKA